MTDELRVHGTGRELVAPDWPPLTLPEVTELLRDFDLAAERIVWLSPRPLAAAALVATGSGTVFVKRHASVVRTVDDLAPEHAFARHLRCHGIPVPEVLADSTGRTAVVRGPWTFEVHAQGAGDDRYRDVMSWEPLLSRADGVAVGGMLARIADAARGFPQATRSTELLVSSWTAVAKPDLVAALTAQVAVQPRLRAALATRPWQRDVEQVLGPWHARLVPHLPSLPPAWTHGDGHASNFLWRGDRITDVLDLGLADRTTPLLDLATAIERHCVSWLDDRPTARLDLLDALLDGWTAVRAFTGDEPAALAALLPLVHVGFALSELAYFDGVTTSAANADLAYDGFLLGHARWFDSASGRQLLAAISGRRSARS